MVSEILIKDLGQHIHSKHFECILNKMMISLKALYRLTVYYSLEIIEEPFHLHPFELTNSHYRIIYAQYRVEVNVSYQWYCQCQDK